MRGRKPKPSELHLVDGTTRSMGRERRKRMDQEPRPEAGVGDGPAEFTVDQREVWRRLQADAPPGLLTRCDKDVLSDYVLLVAARDDAMRRYNEGGCKLLVRRKGLGLVLNPALRELRRLINERRLLGAELGFSPAARARVTIEPDDDDPVREFFKHKA